MGLEPEDISALSEILDLVKTVSMMTLIFGVFAFFAKSMNSHVGNIISHMEDIRSEFDRLNKEIRNDFEGHRRLSSEFKALLDIKIEKLEETLKGKADR